VVPTGECSRPSPHWPTTALVDETQRAGEYLLAAVIVSEPSRAALRDEAVALRIGGGKLHWHSESPARTQATARVR